MSQIYIYFIITVHSIFKPELKNVFKITCYKIFMKMKAIIFQLKYIWQIIFSFFYLKLEYKQ